MNAAEIDAIEVCRDIGIPIIPVVEDLTTFTEVAPEKVGKFNGFQPGATQVSALGG